MKETSYNPQLSRRKFISNLGCLTISFSLIGTDWAEAKPKIVEENLPGALRRQPRLDAWLEVLGDGRVRVLIGKMELGQGVRTAIAQVAAEELDLALNQIEVHLAETERTPNEGYTAGSGSMENTAMSVRYAAAFARQKLLEMAARRWQTESDQLTMANGVVSRKGKKQTLRFAQLLNGAQLEGEVKLPVKLKSPETYRYVGKAIPRTDIEQMVRAQALYVQDLRMPGMVHARVVRPPVYGSKLLSFDEQAFASKAPDLLKTVIDGTFLAVVAADEYQAVLARQSALEHARWSSATPLPEGQDLAQYIRGFPAKSQKVKEQGTTEALDQKDGKTVKASYFKPYQMHGSIGPSCGVALYKEGTLHVWSHSQGIYPFRDALAKMLGLEAEKVHVIGVPGSGCYGHNGADDAATDAALVAMAMPGTPIRLQWMREDEHAWEPYGSAMGMEAEARLDDTGKISHWRYSVWSDGHSNRPGGNPGNLLAAWHLDKPFPQPSMGYFGGGYRNSEPYYDIPNLKIDAHAFEGPLRVSSLRSLGAYANIFAIESLMDELAEKARQDPLDFRLAHSTDERAIAVMKKLGKMIENEKNGPNEGIGLAFSRYKNVASYCAVAAKVAVDKNSGEVKVLGLWAALDAGQVINLDGVINQTEGCLIQATSWTLKEEVGFGQQQISTRDWTSYPIMRYTEVPKVQVVVIDHPELEPLGAGEAAQAPTAAALVNAIYRASGKRIRNLPVKSVDEVG
ncbi:xanthine dehydrogenase family protein molybdopterin-binding subunit [Persicitalea jodogahamensis]|uniref:Aldehyde dehydrogenase n=1 Tax=Persicitalea jodogahamensis TaxID=402147 RepID=A0A8J3D9Y0_9BACT|nr:molybdopterin cofactor-binding domain-containing protein [Persicitalea jodogahamensis]GHB73618.1 aldehyde dehydrogenase [Persicitalea jodogahamensis]